MSQELENRVWNLDRCSGCGMCVALCSKGVLHWDEENHPVREVREKVLGLSHLTLDTCSFCQRFCEESCPRLKEDWVPLPVRSLSSATASLVTGAGQPNDVIRNLLVAAFSAGLLDGVVTTDMDPWTLHTKAAVATSVGEIVDAQGQQFLWAPVLDALNEAVFRRELRNLAVVGAPCVAQAVRCLKASTNARLRPYQDAVRITIASFCTGMYSNDPFNEFLAEELDLGAHSVRRVTADPRNGKLEAVGWDGSVRQIPLERVEKYTRRGCAVCDDYLGESADVAVGCAGAADGHCTLVTRTPAGDICVQNAIDLGLIETGDDVDETALIAAGESKDRRERAQSFDKIMVLALDALGDPKSRTEIRQEYVRLFEIERPVASEKEHIHVGCTGC